MQIDVQEMPLRNRLLARCLRLYPLVSGCGTLANSKLVRALEPPESRDVVALISGGEAVVPSSDYVARAMIYVGDIDRKVSRVLDACLEPGDHALDIGANLGLVTLQMASRVGPSGQVHAFEPMPRMIAYLKASMRRNPELPITLHEIGLGAEADTLTLNVPKVNLGRASFLETNPNLLEEQVEVPVHPLSAYVEQAGITRADVVKIDVEGFEEQVLQGAQAFFQAAQPRAIVLEEHGFKDQAAPLPATFDLLRDLGYDVYAMPRRLFQLALVPLDHAEATNSHDYVALAPKGAEAARARLGVARAT